MANGLFFRFHLDQDLITLPKEFSSVYVFINLRVVGVWSPYNSPSLHVAYSLGILSVGLKDQQLSHAVKTALTAFVILVSFAVCFVKQHSALDVLAALPVCLLAEGLVYGKDYWLPRLQARSSD